MSVAVAALEIPLVTYTIFEDVWPKTKRERADVSWQELVDRVRSSPTYISKKHCPLISMAEYGDLMSGGDNPIIRHAANVQRVFGCEIDYDGEQMPIEEAASKLTDAGISALLYTSPSHTPEKPRWRALLPFSEPYSPEKRQEYVARANRLLGGVATRESFTLSQSFYIGRVTGAEYVVIEVPGRTTIDFATHLDPLYWVDKHSDGSSTYNKRTDADLRACFKSDSGGRYEAMLSLSSRWAARGMSRDDIEESLHALLAQGNTTYNKDGIDLSTRVAPMARSAIAKFGESRAPRQHYSPVPAIDLPPVEDERFPPQEGEPAPAAIEASVFELGDPAAIPPRQWLYGSHYMRGMVSATAGVGGAGKSTLLLVELISMAIGRDLLNGGKEIPLGPMTVWGHNGEDPMDELRRRIGAICLHYGVTRENMGNRLRITSGRDKPVLLARELSDGGKLLVPTDHGKQIVEEITRHGIQVFMADPFVTIHRVNENDNVMVDAVMTLLRDLAHEAKCSVEVAHHFRKLNGDEATVDALRGASSLVGACRSVRIVAGMSKDEAIKYGIGEDHRGFHSWLQNGKANMLPPSHKRRWLKMVSVPLGNASGAFKQDEIGVATPWAPPESDSALNAVEYRQLRAAMLEAKPVNLRADVRSNDWVGLKVARILNLDAKDKSVRVQAQSIIDRLLANGTLVRSVARDHSQGRDVPVIQWNQQEDSE